MSLSYPSLDYCRSPGKRCKRRSRLHLPVALSMSRATRPHHTTASKGGGRSEVSSARSCRMFCPLGAHLYIDTAPGGFPFSSGLSYPGYFILITPALERFHCQIIYVTGGEELTIVSTAASATMENVRIEVVAYTKLILDVPDLTVTGIVQSVRAVMIMFSPS